MIRWLVLPAAVLMQMCLGATYSWAVYVAPIRLVTGVSQGAAQVPFSLFYYVFPLTLMLVGGWAHRVPARVRAAAGGLLFGGAWVLAGLAGSAGLPFAAVAVCIGALGGVGVGLTYLVPVDTAVGWFPRQRGLVTGIAVAGFGGGAALFGRLADHLMTASGYSPFACLTAFGIVFMVVVPLAGLAMATPPGETDLEASSPGDSARPVATRAFAVLFATYTAGLAVGLTVNGNLRQLGAAGAAAAGVALVPLFAAGNAAGRILWGAIADRLRPSAAIAADLALSAATVLAASWLLRDAPGAAWMAGLAGLGYGGVLVVHPATVVRIWGRASFQKVYGWMALGHFPAALMPVVAGRLYDRTGSFVPSLAVLGLLALAAAAVVVAARRRIDAIGG